MTPKQGIGVNEKMETKSDTERVWIETTTDVETIDWKGNPIKLTGVKGLKNKHTGEVGVYPESVALAEMKTLARKHKLEPRDMALILFLYATVGHFKPGIAHHKYGLNKSLFYLWKELEKEGLGEAFPRDNFLAFPAGPVPENLDHDLKRLSQQGLLKTSLKAWGATQAQKSLTTELLPDGMKLAQTLWDDIPLAFRDQIVKVKTDIYPLDPETIKKRVHREYPEYRKTYTEPDTT
jgi:hypothetical protein